MTLSTREVKLITAVQYVLITSTWILVTHEMRTYSGTFTSIGLWQYEGHLLAPYSAGWYYLYKLFWAFGINVFVLSQALIGLAGVLFARGRRSWVYAIVGGVVFFLWIDDMLYFVLSAYGKWYTSIAALVLKLPLGAPLYVWAYIFHTSAGGLFLDNIARYVVLGLLTVQPLLSKMRGLASK